MSADEASEFDEDQQDQEEIMIDNELDHDIHGPEDMDQEGSAEQSRMRINQV